MWLPWDIAAVVAALLLATGVVVRRSDHPAAPQVAPYAFEGATMFGLYTFWRIVGRVSVYDLEASLDRGRRIWDLQQTFGLPDEGAWQAAILPHPWLVQAANIFYGGAHVPAAIITLIWLFVRHRDRYPAIRNALALVTGACLVVQLWPVAPPRFVEELGIIDTPALYNQSVYVTLDYHLPGQLQAMPSIHVAWAAVVAVATLRAAPQRWKWLGPAHLAATMYAVAVTGNHYWLDGLVAIALLAVVMWADSTVRRRRTARAARLDPTSTVAPAHDDSLGPRGAPDELLQPVDR